MKLIFEVKVCFSVPFKIQPYKIITNLGLYIICPSKSGFGLLLWNISHCILFNAKSFVHKYIKYMFSKHIL